jgi:serine/threonine protein kinase
MNSLVGRVVGEYRLLMTTGTGALGETFRAEGLRNRQTTAVKVLHQHLSSDPMFARRFRETVAQAAALRHPGIIGIEDHGESAGHYYVAMEFFGDGSLRTLLQRREEQLPLRRGLTLVRMAAEALAYAHGQGVVHRDLKPENLLLRAGKGPSGEGDQIKLADVGLSRLLETGLTMGGNAPTGSLAYMSPELCKGLPQDARSDIYSLGIVLYEVATGYPPFQLKTLAEAMTKHGTVAPPSPRALVRDLPEELERIIMRCLAKAPADRFASGSELSHALQQVIATLKAPPLVSLTQERRGAEGPVVSLEDDRPRVVLRDEHDGARAAPPPPRAPEPPGAPRRYRVDLDAPAASGAVSSRSAPAPQPPAEPPNVKVREDTGPRPTMPFSMPDAPRGAGGTPRSDSKRIRVALDRDALTLTPGQPAVLSVTLDNTGRTVDHFTLSVDGVPDTWVRGPISGAQLNPGSRATVPLTITVPRVPESLAGDYPVTVRATSKEKPSDSGVANAHWTVLPFAQSVLSLTPSRARGWRKAKLRATVRNQGNAPARYTMSGADEEQVLRCTFAQQQLPLAPGETGSLKLVATAPLRLVGSAELRPFTVRAEPAPIGGAASSMPEPPLVAQGQFVHRALIPSWVPPLLIMAVLALAYFWRERSQISVAVLPPSAIVAIGATTRLSAAVTNKQNEQVPGRTVSWSSSDTTIATVSDSGVVRGLKEGIALITARSARTTATGQVNVVTARVEGLSINPKRLTLKVGGSATLRFSAQDANGTPLRRDATWQSSDPMVLTVGGNGRVSAKAPGTATVTAMVEGKTATADITVPEPPVVAAVEEDQSDCTAYEPGPLRVTADQAAGWIVTDGSANLLTLDNESDARKALALAARFKSHCFLGRGNSRPNRSDYIIEYWDQPTGAPTRIDAEDCVGYDRSALRITEAGGNGFFLGDGRTRLLAADTKEDAQKAWEIAQASRQLCFIGRGNRRVNQRDYIVQYWK